MTILSELVKCGNPLVGLESRLGAKDLIDAQVGFCAQWCLDNLCKDFIVD